MLTVSNPTTVSNVAKQMKTLYDLGVWSVKQYNKYSESPYAKQRAAVYRARQSVKPGNLRRGKTTGKVEKLTKQVRKLQVKSNTSLATHTFRQCNSTRLLCPQNEADYIALDANTVSYLQSAYAGLRYYDSSTDTLVVRNPTSANYSQDLLIKNQVASLEIVNNYLTPVNVKVYTLTSRDDSSINAATLFNTGMVDQNVVQPLTDINIYPSDCDMLKDVWKISKTTTKTLSGGATMNVSHSGGGFTFNPSVFDTHALNYQKQYKGSVFLIRIQGTPTHDTITPNVQIGQCGIDIIRRYKYVFQYNAGRNLNDFTTDNGLIDGTANVTTQVVRDNQTYDPL